MLLTDNMKNTFESTFFVPSEYSVYHLNTRTPRLAPHIKNKGGRHYTSREYSSVTANSRLLISPTGRKSTDTGKRVEGDKMRRVCTVTALEREILTRDFLC
jgi:hypothetical protein